MTACPGREVLAGPACPSAAIMGPPGETAAVLAATVLAATVLADPVLADTVLAAMGPAVIGLRVPPPVNPLTVSARDTTATAAPARWSFRIYRPFLSGGPTLRGGRAG